MRVPKVSFSMPLDAAESYRFLSPTLSKKKNLKEVEYTCTMYMI